ncbi:MAG: hypothetical protein JWO36_5968 [Myxococcales bacterium]|nr:hypothetical protein [Myxococcales bacterium]
MTADLELTVLQQATGQLGFLAGFAVSEQLILAVGGTSGSAPTVLASSNARHFEPRRTPCELGLRDLVVIGDSCWACGEFGQLAITRDRGASWTSLATGTDACLFGLAAARDGAVWVVGDRGYAGRIVDDQLERIDLGTTVRLTAAEPVRDEIVVLGGDGAIRRWRDRKVTTIATGSTRLLTALAVTKSGTWIVIGDGGFIARSPDGSWFSRAKSGVEVDLEAIAVLGDGRLIVVGDRGQVLVSADDGRTWNSVETALTAHLWSVERFGGGALIGGDEGLIVKLAPPGDATWADRANLFGEAFPLDEMFASGPDGFIRTALQAYIDAIQTVEVASRDDDSDDDPPDDAVLGTPGTARDFEINIGRELPTEARWFFEIVAGKDPWNTFHELRLDSALLPDVGGRNLFELIVRRDQQAYLGTTLVEAFCGVFCIGSQRNGDTYHLEIYGWDGPRQIVHWDHQTQSFTGVVADCLDSLVYLAAVSRAEQARLVSKPVAEAGLRRLFGKVAPTWHFQIEERVPDLVRLDAKRRETEFFHYRSRWITALLKNDGLTEVGDLASLFIADLNQALPSEQVEARLEMCGKYIPTALYSMWRAYLFDEPELPQYLEIARRHTARLVRDAAELVDELIAGRNELGTIKDWQAHVRAFRALDLDPRRARERQLEHQAKAEAEHERKATARAELEQTPEARWTELAWRWVEDGAAHRALLEKLDQVPEHAAQIAALDELRKLTHSDREVAVPALAGDLSPELEAILVGTLVRDDELPAALTSGHAAGACEDELDDDTGLPDPARVIAALAMTERALRLASDDPDAQFTHAMLLVDAHRCGIEHKVAELVATLPRFEPSVRVNVAVRLAKLDIDEFVDAVDAVLGDPEPASYDDVSRELFSQLAAAILERAPGHIPKLIALLPDDAMLLSELAWEAMQADQRDAALVLYDRLLAMAIPDDRAERTSYLRCLNNACVQTHASQSYELAVRIAERGEPVAHENPHLFHAAACAYAAVNDYAKALEQVKLAFEHEYEHLEKLETDADLGPLLESTELKSLFRDWHARREGN